MPDVYDNDKIKSMNGGQVVGRGRAATMGYETLSDLQTRMNGAFGLVSSGNGTSPVTVFDIIKLF